jgi:hypothetical protein
MTGSAGLAQARRRFGVIITAAPVRALTTHERAWQLEDLLTDGARGTAEAAARRGNLSARRALNDLRSAVAGLSAEGDDVA